MSGSSLIAPYGGHLVDLIAAQPRRDALRQRSRDWPSWSLTPRQLCDLELLLCGAFSPLRGFIGHEDHERVCAEMRLANGVLWPLPITLDVCEATARHLEPGSPLALRDPEGQMLAVLEVSELFRPDRAREARQTLGSDSNDHPGARHLLHDTGPVCVAGRLEGLRLPVHYDFHLLRHTPRELRSEFERRSWRRIVGYQTRRPIHRLHHAITLRAAAEHQANLLIHPVVGTNGPGDVETFTRVRSYQAVLPRYPAHTVMLSLLPFAARMAGPREALLHAIVHRNFGCTHLIIGRGHGEPDPRAAGRRFYPPFAAQELAQEHAAELGVEVAAVGDMVYCPELDRYDSRDALPPRAATAPVSDAEVRRRLVEDRQVPRWLAFPEVVRQLRQICRPRHRQGFTVLFTGLSGAGKSTIANVLVVRLLEMGGRPVTLLDGDIVRKHLSSELTFSREHRDINIRRIGFVASEIAKNGGIAICAPIAPYDTVRRQVRAMSESVGGFVLVHVSTPLEVCEARDRKGIYAKARAGLIRDFTGVSDPYEPPEDAELVVDTSDTTPEQSAQQVLLYLEKEGYVSGCHDNGP